MQEHRIAQFGRPTRSVGIKNGHRDSQAIQPALPVDRFRLRRSLAGRRGSSDPRRYRDFVLVRVLKGEAYVLEGSGFGQQRGIISSSPLISRRPPAPSPRFEFDSTPFQPPESRSITFKCGYWIPPQSMEAIFDRLTQGRKTSLQSVEIGRLCADGDFDTVNLIRLLERFGSGLKRLKVDGTCDIDGGHPRLGSVCPNLEELDSI
jgi:hypothetical protein